MAPADIINNLGSYTGPDGTVITSLERFLPAGFKPFWLIVILEAILIFDIVRKLKDKQGVKSIVGQAAFGVLLLNFILPIPPLLILIGLFLFVSTMLVWNIHKMELKGMIGSLAFLWLCSWLLFSNALAGIMAGVGAAGIAYMIKRHIKKAEFGSKAEQQAAKEMGFPVAQDIKAVKMEEKIEKLGAKEEHGELKELGEVTEDAAKVEERNVEETIHVQAIAAGVAEIGQEIEKLRTAEVATKDRNKKIEDMIRNLDGQLKSINNSKDIDDAAAKVLEQFMSSIIKLMGELVNDEKYEETYRKHALDVFSSTVRMLKDATSEAYKISSLELVNEASLKRAANASVKKLERLLEGKERDLERAFSKYSSVKDAETKRRLKDAMDNIAKERDILKQEHAKLAQIGNYLQVVLGKHNGVLKKLKSDAARLTDIEKNLWGTDKKMEVYDKSIQASIAKMKDSYTKFTQETGKLEKGEIPEELAVVLSEGTGSIFGEMVGVLGQSKEFTEKELLPFMEKNRFLIQDAYKIQESAEFCNIASMKLNEAVKALDQMALDVVKGTVPDSGKIQKELLLDIEAEKWEEDVSRFAEKKGIKTKNVFKQAENQLVVGQEAARELVSTIGVEIAQAEDTKKLTLDALVGATDTLLKNRVRLNKDFQAKADQVMADLKKEKKVETQAKAAA
jgi:hypothetical protein